MPTPAVVLLSGGLDSATVLAMAGEQGFAAHALTIRYGQRHAIEVDAARRVADRVGVQDHKVIDVNLRLFGGSALTDEVEVPKDTPEELIGREIPATYVPARNTVFLSLALAWAEVLHAQDIFIGVNALDYSGYPDCRPQFLDAFSRMATLATKRGVEGNMRLHIHAPLVHLSKAEIITRGTALGVDYGLTVSCYDPGDHGEGCGSCEACVLRRNGFAAAGVQDPTQYQSGAMHP
jgi:7-cyano-7-deazaguanine synthase